MKEPSEINFTVKHWYNFKLTLFLESIIVGLLSGLVVVGFRFFLGEAYYIRQGIFQILLQNRWWYTLIWVIILGFAGIILGVIIRKYPLIRGSGIPQVKGVLLRQIQSNWLPEGLLKYFGGILGIGLGLSLGREGPSVQLGSYVGEGFASLTRRPPLEKKYLISSGAAAGLAAAFNAPLAGVIFVLEELHKNFSSILLICSMTASVSANFISGKIFGLKPVFNFGYIPVIPLKYYHYLFLFCLLTCLGGELFKRGLYRSQDFYIRFKIPVALRPILPLILTIPIGFFAFDLLGGGHHLIEKLNLNSDPLILLLVYFAIRLFYTLFAYGSGVPGGIFLPILVLGALLGKIYGTLLFNLGLIENNYITNFIILGMASYFTSVVKAPVTGAVLILEMSGTFNHFMGLISVCMFSYIVAELIKSKPVYDTLLERLLERNPQIFKGDANKKVILEIPVGVGSFLEHKKIKDISWPEDILIIGIRRGDREIIPRGDAELYQGDILHILAHEKDASKYKQDLLALGILKD